MRNKTKDLIDLLKACKDMNNIEEQVADYFSDKEEPIEEFEKWVEESLIK